MHLTEKKRFHCVRLDSIKEIELCKPLGAYDTLKQALINNHPYIWGVSFQNSTRQRLEKVKLTLHIHEETEPFIIGRLEREGKGGIITKVAPDTYTYETEVFDSQEMLPWLRTFTGRIIDLECDNDYVKRQFTFDMQRMFELYNI